MSSIEDCLCATKHFIWESTIESNNQVGKMDPKTNTNIYSFRRNNVENKRIPEKRK